jgi:hypothetical protein
VLSGSSGRGAAGLAPADVHVLSDNAASVGLGPLSWAVIDFALQ